MGSLLYILLVLVRGSAAFAVCPPSSADEFAKIAQAARPEETPPQLAVFRYARTAEEKRAALLSVFNPGPTDFLPADELARYLSALTASEKDAWLEAVVDVYRKLPKPINEVKGEPLGRRALDRMLSLLQRVDRRFPADRDFIDEAEFIAILNAQTKLFRSAYDGAAVVAALRNLQDSLRQIRPGLDTTGNYRPTMVIGGSFVNGRAVLGKSDIDLAITDTRIQEFQEQLQAAINRAFPNAGGNPLEAKFEMVPASFFGSKHPIVIHVGPDRVEIQVFAPGIVDPDSGLEKIYPGSSRTLVLVPADRAPIVTPGRGQYLLQ